MSEQIEWSVVVPVHNSAGFFQQFLNSIPNDLPDDTEIIIVDDCSSDGTCALVESHHIFNKIKLLRTPVNSGPATARNLGAKMAQGRRIIFFDADVVLSTDVFSYLREYFKQYPHMRCLTGINTKESAAQGFISRFHALYSYYALSLIPENSEASTWNPRVGVIERKLFLDLGGFEIKYRRADVEDFALSKKICKITPIYFSTRFKVMHRFADLNGSTKSFFKRSGMWIKLLFSTRQIDKTGHTRVGMLPSFLVSFLLVPAALCLPWQPLYFLSLLIVHFLLNYKITAYFLREAGIASGLLYSLLVIYFNWVAQIGISVGIYEYFHENIKNYLAA